MTMRTAAMRIRTDTASAEVALLPIAHTIAARVSENGAVAPPDVDQYLAAFDKVYKGLSATVRAQGLSLDPTS
jgi:hypothetical protein